LKTIQALPRSRPGFQSLAKAPHPNRASSCPALFEDNPGLRGGATPVLFVLAERSRVIAMTVHPYGTGPAIAD
jgi:hypothetical protein